MHDIVVSDEFLAELDAASPDLRDRTLRTIRFLAEDPAYPSLNAHRINRAPGKWECYISESHRIIYELEGDAIRLWKMGDHSIIDKVQKFSFSPHTPFRRLEQEAPVPVAEPEFEIPDEWMEPRQDREPDNPFRYLATAHLRMLTVPPNLIKAVRTVPYLEDLERIPGLPERALNWLLDLATNPRLEDALFDPGRLIFRATLDQLEGYCKGRITRLMLNLSVEQKPFVDPDKYRNCLLRGCAGSGKTTVALYRALALADRGERVIFVTFNKTLARVARTLIQELIGPLPDNLHVIHLDAWIVRFLRDRGHKVDIVSNDDQRKMIKAARAQVRGAQRSFVLSYRWTFFRDEITRVIKGNGLRREEDYLAIPRYGRKKALQEAARKAVWAVYQAYQKMLDQQGLLDWQDVTLKAYQELLTHPLPDPYDHVVIDETQDLTAMQLRVAQRLNKGGNPTTERSLFLVGDVAQTLYSRGFSWKQAGLQLQGRSYSLRRNFRNTREIAESAAVLNAYNRLLKMTEEYVDPEFTTRTGPWPIVLECDVTDREQSAVSEKILSLVEDQEFRLADFAILCPTLALCDESRETLDRLQVPCAVHTDDEFEVLEEQVKILTIHSAKGLEFPVVFLLGLHAGTLPRRIYQADDEETVLEVERDRTLMYVGMTRAAEGLYLVTSQQTPSSFLSEIARVVRVEPFTGGKA